MVTRNCFKDPVYVPAGDSNFDPASLFLAGNKGECIDVNRRDLISIGINGSGGCPIDNGFVGRIVGAINGITFSTLSDVYKPVFEKCLGGGYRLVYDGVNDRLQTSNIDGFASSETMTVVCVCSAVEYSANSALFAIRRDSDINESFLFYPFDISGGNGSRIKYNGEDIINVNGATLANGNIQIFMYVQEEIGIHRFYHGLSEAAVSYSNKRINTAVNNINIGSFHVDGYFKGKLGNLFYINRALNAIEREQLFHYLTMKYN